MRDSATEWRRWKLAFILVAVSVAAHSFDEPPACTHTIDLETLGREADRLNRASDVAGAIACLKKLVHLAPSSHLAWLQLGDAQRSAGQLEDALASLRKSVKLHGSKGIAHLLLAATAQSLEYVDEATAAYEKVLSLEPANSAALVNFANLLAPAAKANPNGKPAERKVRPTDRSRPHPQPCADVARCRTCRLQRCAHGIQLELLRAAIKHSPDLAEAHYNYADARYNAKDLDASLAAVKVRVLLTRQCTRTAHLFALLWAHTALHWKGAALTGRDCQYGHFAR
jgi:tetratricopeptide (TPR) repeat protein